MPTCRYEVSLSAGLLFYLSNRYYDFEDSTPQLIDILRYFKVGKMNFSMKDDSLSSEKIRDIQNIVCETVYEYICERQVDLLYRINWAIPVIWVKHFIDHFKRILPVFDKKTIDGGQEISKFKDYFRIDESTTTELTSTQTSDVYK